jgi:7-cyano-7-deazaguanine reductase
MAKRSTQKAAKSAANKMAEAVESASKKHSPKHKGLKQLGKATALPASPDEALLERVPNSHSETLYVARLTVPEFTCLCPVTGQPDFAHFVLDYAPGDWLVESKSFKLFLGSFRNTAAFHENTTLKIGKAVVGLLEPSWLRIGGYWFPRGGIPIDVFWQYGAEPEGIWIPDQGVAPYRGRG